MLHGHFYKAYLKKRAPAKWLKKKRKIANSFSLHIIAAMHLKTLVRKYCIV